MVVQTIDSSWTLPVQDGPDCVPADIGNAIQLNVIYTTDKKPKITLTFDIDNTLGTFDIIEHIT